VMAVWQDFTSAFNTPRYLKPVGASPHNFPSGSAGNQCPSTWVADASSGVPLALSGGLWRFGANDVLLQHDDTDEDWCGGRTMEEPHLVAAAPILCQGFRATGRVTSLIESTVVSFANSVIVRAWLASGGPSGLAGSALSASWSLATVDSDQIVQVEFVDEFEAPISLLIDSITSLALRGEQSNECGCFGSSAEDACFWVPLRTIELLVEPVGSVWENFINCSEVTP
jgi:hypothetical protein